MFGPQSQGAFLGPYPLVAWGDYVLALTQLPTVEARVAETGELVWRVPLTDEQSGGYLGANTQPMVMELIDGVLWVGVMNGRVLAIDPARGEIKGQAYVQGSSFSPAPVAIERLQTNGNTHTVIVTGDGTLHGIAP